MANVMAGDREAAGAIAGMQDVYGRPRFDEGQWVRGECYGKKFSGRVLEDFGDGICVEIDGVGCGRIGGSGVARVVGSDGLADSERPGAEHDPEEGERDPTGMDA